MKKYLFICLSLAAMLSGCSTEEEVSRSDFKALSFETFVGKGTTRAVAKTSFAEGDDFGIFAYKHGTDSWSADVTKTLFMDNVKVSLQSGAWTYAPLKYWEEGVNHTFLAYSPYNEGYVQDPGKPGQLFGITTAALASDQKDLLYSIPESGSKDLVWAEGRKVTMTFRHALSQIKVSAATDQDYSGYYTVTIKKVSLTGIGNTGNLNLNAADAGVSPWNNIGTTITEANGEVVSTGTLDTPLTAFEALLNGDDNLFMQIPQNIPPAKTAFKITYNVEATAAGSMSNNGEKVAVIEIPETTWEHNHIYHYKIQMDLQQLLGLKPIEVGEPDVVEWEQGGETKLPEDLTVTIQPSTTGDTEQTAKGNATLGITKGNTAGETQTVKIVNPEKDDQWIVEVGPEIKDVTAPATRVEKKEPAGWLRVRRQGEGNNPLPKLYGNTDADIEIVTTEANTAGAPRQAEVTIRRALSGVTRILVTQAQADAAIIEANSTQFSMLGGTNQLTIVNPSTETWTLTKSEGSEWLSLKTSDGRSEVTTGVDGISFNAVATANDTPDVRKATITLTRTGQDPITVEVTQEAPRPMGISFTAAALPYGVSSYTQTVTNPEAEKEGFNWTLTGGENLDWLKVSKRAGTGQVTDNVVFTTTLNTSTTANRGPVTFTLTRKGQKDITFTVGQRAASPSSLSTSTINATYAAGTYTFNVASPGGIPWRLTSSVNWMKLSTTSGNGNAKVNVSVTENTYGQPARSGIVTLSREGQTSVTLTLTQGTAPELKTTATPQVYREKPSDVINRGKEYVFQINAQPGKKWTAEIQGVLYPYDKYMSFSQTDSNVKTTERTGPGQLKVYMHNITSTTIGLGLIMIKPENEEELGIGFVISNNN